MSRGLVLKTAIINSRATLSNAEGCPAFFLVCVARVERARVDDATGGISLPCRVLLQMRHHLSIATEQVGDAKACTTWVCP